MCRETKPPVANVSFLRRKNMSIDLEHRSCPQFKLSFELPLIDRVSSILTNSILNLFSQLDGQLVADSADAAHQFPSNEEPNILGHGPNYDDKLSKFKWLCNFDDVS